MLDCRLVGEVCEKGYLAAVRQLKCWSGHPPSFSWKDMFLRNPLQFGTEETVEELEKWYV